MKSAVIYTRVSTDRQAEKDLSLPAQLEICRRYARENGLVVSYTPGKAGGLIKP